MSRYTDTDYWSLDGIDMATPQLMLTSLDGLRATSDLRRTGTDVPGRPGTVARHDLDTADEATLSMTLLATDWDADGNRALSYDGRRRQVDANLATLLALLNTAGRRRTVRHVDLAGRGWSASYRVEQRPRIDHDVRGVWAGVTADLTLPSGMLVAEQTTTIALAAGANTVMVPGSNGPLTGLVLTMPGAGEGDSLTDVGGPDPASCRLGAGGSGTWVLDVDAWTSVVGGAGAIRRTVSSGTAGARLLSVLPAVAADGSAVYKINSTRAATLVCRGTRL